MRNKLKSVIFICSITENSIKVIKCGLGSQGKEISGLEIEPLPPDIDDAKSAKILNAILKRAGFANDRVILSLPLNQATCRYLKVPSVSQREIDNIVSLQAARFLPFPSSELITGYQVLFTDKLGYSHINLTIAHKEIIERYLNVLKAADIKKVDIFLSSYGISNIYSGLKPSDKASAIAVDTDSNTAELVIISNKKMLFNRYFKFNKKQPGWENLFAEEINKTKDAYLKEFKNEPPVKITLLSKDTSLDGLTGIITKTTGLPVETLVYTKGIKTDINLADRLLELDTSFAGLIGLGLEELPASLNILPRQMKMLCENRSRLKERLNLGLFILGTILALSFAIVKTLDNKTSSLKELKKELTAESSDAKLLENIEKRIKLLGERSQKTTSALDIIYCLHKEIGPEISLTNLTFTQGQEVTLRGEAAQLNSIFSLVSRLENSSVFKKFHIKVRYATQKKTSSGERIDFEIVASEK